MGKWCLIVAVWVDPEAVDEQAVYLNNRVSTITALERGHRGPDGDGIARWRSGEPPANPFFR